MPKKPGPKAPKTGPKPVIRGPKPIKPGPKVKTHPKILKYGLTPVQRDKENKALSIIMMKGGFDVSKIKGDLQLIEAIRRLEERGVIYQVEEKSNYPFVAMSIVDNE